VLGGRGASGAEILRELLHRLGEILGRFAAGLGGLPPLLGIAVEALQILTGEAHLAREALGISDQLDTNDDVVHDFIPRLR
jgi:hypothetical protein